MVDLRGIDFGDTTKINRHGTHRVISPNETINRIKELLPKVGITRIADLTGLDRLGVPVFSATVPNDRCGISVNNGKGTTMEAAKVGAMMETIETFCAENIELPVITASYEDLSKKEKVLDPYSIPSYIDLEQNLHTEVLDWVPSIELFSGDQYYVPASLVSIPWEGNGRGIWIESTNGLGSGNVIEEAICHALNEVVERDARTLAILKATIKPNLPSIIDGKPLVPSDTTGFPMIDINTVPQHLYEISKRIEKEGVKLIIRDITSDIGIPTFSAALVEENWEGEYYCHGGAGTHPDAEIALERAITEAAQSRLTDFQGTREDMSEQAPSQKPNDLSFMTSDRGEMKSFNDCVNYKNQTIEEDVRCILDRLWEIGRNQAFLINLNKKELQVPVVRILIPQLEMWVLNHFDIKGCVLGERGREILELE
ncbi:YcaO-like family protein [Cytobacillus sp. IB215665]|uniref:YcaO-like family protein n=1 Tax=Cytobacillus sp. IB215665 TaxID=3097357 RepID=UPI002A173F5E|nr:YcaO-like family protein [Cytobacillus sp. IB215665]MDX8367010.1 YcaO-like family protein [Cytobacillus sp. IB215665]